jgi:hypothetical protein
MALRRAVLLVVGVQDEQDLERALEHGIDVVAVSDPEHHLEEVGAIAELAVRVDVGQPARMPVGESGHGGDLGDQAVDLLVRARRDRGSPSRRVEGRERGHRRGQHPHRMGVVAEARHQLLDVLVDERVVRDRVHPGLELPLQGQLALEDEVRGLQVRAPLRELLDGIAAVAENAAVAVDEGDAAAAGRGVHRRPGRRS